MKKHINLLTKKKDYTRREKIFGYFRKFTLIFAIVTLGIFVLVFIAKMNLEDEYEGMLKLKQQLLKESLSTKEKETKISYINQKGDYFQKASARDMQFLPYYSVLETYLLNQSGGTASESAKIQEIKFNNKREIEASIIIAGVDNLESILKNLEDESLLNFFETLVADKISAVNVENQIFEVILKGNFKPINAT